MYIIYGYANLFLPYCSSLKEKRKLINSLISRIRKRFNISISEVGGHELWQRSSIGFSAVSYNNSDLEVFLNAIRETLDLYPSDIEVTSVVYDIITKKI